MNNSDNIDVVTNVIQLVYACFNYITRIYI